MRKIRFMEEFFRKISLRYFPHNVARKVFFLSKLHGSCVKGLETHKVKKISSWNFIPESRRGLIKFLVHPSNIGSMPEPDVSKAPL